MVIEGLKLMILGMGVVGIFLAIMVAAISLTARLLKGASEREALALAGAGAPQLSATPAQAEESAPDEEERRRKMARENWRLQMEMNGCGPDGNPLPREKKLEMMGYGPDGNPLPKEKKRSKYGNRRVEVDGKKFDSEHEARVYEELMLRVQAGELRCVMRQVPFDLPGGIRYFADFVTVGADLRVTVLDAKSEATRKNRVYINKRKQMLACNGIEVVEV